MTAEAERPRDGLPAESSRLGRYHVLHKLGAGGMGTVYVGFDEGLDRRVALKILHRGAAARDWLIREGQALGKLAHPNVVAIHEVGEYEGRVFLAMELVTGATLTGWLDERPRRFGEVLYLFQQAGRGLAAAHRAGLVHRDFKPDNVLVGTDGRARVSDFGIAALAQPESQVPVPPSADTPLGSPGGTHSASLGLMVGTMAFMAPEQFRGDRASTASDQWSFMVSLYRALYGALPYPTDDEYTFLNSIQRDPPIKPPRRADVPDWLWPILERGLARDPARRFPSMEAALAAIEAHVPRDPEQDPTLVIRERQILSAVFMAYFMALSILLLIPATARLVMQPMGFIALPIVLLFGLVATALVRWQRLGRNRYGRQLALVFPAVPIVLLGHHLIALHMGFTMWQILVEDACLASVFAAALALTVLPWTGWQALINAGVAVTAALSPKSAATAVGTGGLLSFVAVAVRLYLDRHMSPEAAVQPLLPEHDSGEISHSSGRGRSAP